MRVYLDNCCYNRPYDPQGDLRIVLGTLAKLQVQHLMRIANPVEFMVQGGEDDDSHE